MGSDIQANMPGRECSKDVRKIDQHRNPAELRSITKVAPERNTATSEGAKNKTRTDYCQVASNPIKPVCFCNQQIFMHPQRKDHAGKQHSYEHTIGLQGDPQPYLSLLRHLKYHTFLE